MRTPRVVKEPASSEIAFTATIADNEHMPRRTSRYVVSHSQWHPTLSIERSRKDGAREVCFFSRWGTRRFLWFAIAFSSLTALGAPHKPSLLNKPAPSFARTTLNNERVDLGALRGRVVLLNFWATWCAPCQVEMPRFVSWQEKYSGQGLSIVGVSMDDDGESVQSYLRKKKLNYPVVMGDEKLGHAYGGVLGLPVTYLIDRQGVIRARYEGETHLDAMETAIRRLLKGQ
jgi:cytochrome c biogenesis protein CcmG, thiol:disulfide interchange protein DsbE